MIPNEFLEIARAYQLLSELEPRHVSALLPLAKSALIKRDQIIFAEGAKSEHLYLIIAGTVALEVIAAGRPVCIQKLNAGDAMGWSALSECDCTHFQARALTQVSALAFRGEDLRRAFADDPELGYTFMRRLLSVVKERLDAARMQLADLWANRAGVGR